MNNKDLLDIFGEIDEELVEDAAPVEKKEAIGKAPAPKKISFAWVKPVSIAAGFVLIICGVLASKSLFDRINSSDLIDPGETDETQGEFDGGVNESPNDGDLEGVPDDDNVEGSPDYGDNEVSPPQGNGGVEEDDGQDSSGSDCTSPVVPVPPVGDGPENEEETKESGDVWDEPIDPLSDFAAIIHDIGRLSFINTVRYNNSLSGSAPPRFTLDGDLLQGIADVLYICNGEPVYGLSSEDLGGESVVLEHAGENSVGFEVHINGYIAVNCIYYYVGEEYTVKIIEIVKTEGKAAY